MNLKKVRHSFLLLVFSCLLGCSGDPSNIIYRSSTIDPSFYPMRYIIGNWEHPNYTEPFETYGNQRVEIATNLGWDIARIDILWRRRDNNPEQKRVMIVDKGTNEPLTDVQVLSVTNEVGSILFKPNSGSLYYYVYYYPHKSTGGYYPRVEYLKPDSIPTIIADSESIEEIPQATIISAQSIDEFHSMFPMEVIASEDETNTYFEKYPQPYYLFPEYRERSIRMQDYLPIHWVKAERKINGLELNAMKGEYMTFQVGLFSPSEDLSDITISPSDLTRKSASIPKSSITCFNAEGIDLNGLPFETPLSVKQGKVQALWFGIDIPEEIKSGTYRGQVVIQPTGLEMDTVFIKLNISDETIENHGHDNPENLSRMSWLNSTIGSETDRIIRPFTPVEVSEKSISILGHQIQLGADGFPDQINSFFSKKMTGLQEDGENILAKPIELVIPDQDWQNEDFQIQQIYNTAASWNLTRQSEGFDMLVNGRIEYDGMLEYEIDLVAKQDASYDNMSLSIPMHKEATKYILGLGFKGGERQSSINWKWDIENHQEGVWLGNVNKGLQYVLRDENYVRPLNTNFYQNQPLVLPEFWYNEGKGGINISEQGEIVRIDNYSGPRSVSQGDTLNLHIRFLITPFKHLEPETHFTTRFVHKYVPIDSVLKWNGTIVNVHHANEINPYINYPFYNLDLQKAYIDEAHSKGVKVKLYNTIRELTYKAHELFAFKSLGTEILNDGEGGGHGWLQEHFKSNYHRAWHATRVNDAAILNKGNSRWTNYYVEGINWLAKNQEIDGLYLDDIAFSRSTVKRIASVFDDHREDWVIDLHSANQYNPRDGFTNSAFLYMEHFPYVTRLWFGEYFEYDLKPDYWMTEVSGIPFGLYGEMLEKGGHPYRGLVYGMTTRVYGNYNPQAIWQLFDEFEIASSDMIGYWVENSPIKILNDKLRSTVYVHENRILICIGSWSDRDEQVNLEIDWEELNLERTSVRLSSPEIDGLQTASQHKINEPIRVPANEGLILLIENQN